MPGVTIRVAFDGREVRDALERLARAGADLAPAMREIGEVLTSSEIPPLGCAIRFHGNSRRSLPFLN